jgi:hypothetical protein
MKLVNLVKDIILEQSADIDSGTYSYSDINVKDNFVFFNNIELIDSKPIFVWYEGDEDPTGEYALVGESGKFQFPSRDSEGISVLKNTTNGKALFVTKNNFEKYYPNFDLNTTIGSIVSEIKGKYFFMTKMNSIMKSIYGNLTNNDGEPMYGESVKDDNCKTNNGVINFMGVKYGVGDKLVSDWSILNYFNTNSKVITYLVNLYLNESDTTVSKFSFKDFIKWLEDNKLRLFSPESKYLPKLEELNLTTLRPGYIREQMALGVLISYHNIDEGGITQYCPGSIEDTINGRDLKINGEDIYYQVKPLTGDMLMTDDGKYLIPTHSMKKYGDTVDRFIFINTKGNKYYIFENKDYVVSGGGKYITFNDKPLHESNFK